MKRSIIIDPQTTQASITETTIIDNELWSLMEKNIIWIPGNGDAPVSALLTGAAPNYYCCFAAVSPNFRNAFTAEDVFSIEENKITEMPREYGLPTKPWKANNK